jgi:hypothetical protein
VRDYYYFYHGSDLRKIIQILHEIECIQFECNQFVLVLFKIDGDGGGWRQCVGRGSSLAAAAAAALWWRLGAVVAA